jgi:hypothetical protein
MIYIDNADKAYHIVASLALGKLNNGPVLGHLAGVLHAELDSVLHGVRQLHHQAPGQSAVWLRSTGSFS